MKRPPRDELDGARGVVYSLLIVVPFWLMLLWLFW